MLFQGIDNRNKEVLLPKEVSHSVFGGWWWVGFFVGFLLLFCQHADAFSSSEETGDISCMSVHMKKIIYMCICVCIYMKLQKFV